MSKSPEFTIVDLRSGRGLGGHCFDYLVALRAAFADRDFAVIAPFIEPDAAPNNRLNVYARGFFAYRRAISARGIGLVHNSSMNDYVSLAAAALTVRPSQRGFCLMMLYRDPSVTSFGAGSERVNRTTIWLISRMIRAGVLRPASDSPLVLEHWLRETQTEGGAVVPTPPLPTGDEEPGSELALPEHAEPLIVIPGRMRAEKGSANYAAAVKATLERFEGSAIVLQTGTDDDASAAALAALRSEFAGNQRVVLVDEHLTGAAYAALLEAADIVVLPYDTAAYGAGSSGVVGDALGSGAVVVAAPIEWIRLEHGENPRVVLVDDPSSVSQLGDALEAAAAIGSSGESTGDVTTDFAAKWNRAVDEAISSRQ